MYIWKCQHRLTGKNDFVICFIFINMASSHSILPLSWHLFYHSQPRWPWLMLFYVQHRNSPLIHYQYNRRMDLLLFSRNLFDLVINKAKSFFYRKYMNTTRYCKLWLSPSFRLSCLLLRHILFVTRLSISQGLHI